MATKLVVFGLPWDVDSEGLRKHMAKFGPLEDCVVMKNVLECEHFLGNRPLEVKIAIPREELKPQPPGTKTATRIFVGRIPQSADESMFRRHFEAFGEIIDLYMPKEHGSKGHRGIGFITFQSAESVDSIMQESHEFDGTTLHVDRATPKHQDEDIRHPPSRPSKDGGDYGLGYGAYDVYIAAATMFGALGPPTRYDHPGSAYGRGYSGSPQGTGKKIFVGGIPQEANKDDLRNYFGGFGRVANVFIPRDPKGSGHRAFGFVTFSDEGVADKVADKSHEILGCKVTVDIAAPPRGDSSGRFADPMPGVDLHAPPYGSMRPFGMFCGNLGYDRGYGPSGGGSRSRMDGRHRPY
ncbi:heterogeneous nuclear ribonucleoproteins A2/B1 isoform X3 [Triticum aestivum]|uniref:heterogeneous nuclear ribonucleoproteins A2/B1 isoform X3 n=1 Tax=Triticum aestivum TaxID=4565 RepID=UPI001D00CE59|nr:heterogeneous nuclear ribonucleoproteins A2/B1-like isoform X3 [Triticum aestivum]